MDHLVVGYLLCIHIRCLIFQFEWAWQHPEKSRRLRHLPKKRGKEKAYDYRFRILCNMLRTGPWNRLALTIRWLKQEYRRDFPPELPPPMHMAVAYGLVKPKRVTGENKNEKVDSKGDNLGNDEEEELRISQTGKHPRCAVCYKRIKVSFTVDCRHLLEQKKVNFCHIHVYSYYTLLPKGEISSL